MVHGMPDYGASTSKANLFTGVDLAEVAARLGAFSRYDRLGDVLFQEGFESGLGAWETEKSGTGAAVEIVADRHLTGGFSCKITGGSDGGRYAGIITRLPVPFSVINGFEWAWTLHADMEHAYMLVEVYTGSFIIACGLKYDIAAQQNYYYDNVAGWTAIGDPIVPLLNDRNFIVTKFTFDLPNVAYSRFLASPDTYDIKGKGGYVAVDATQPYMKIRGRVISQSGKNAVSYLDSLIVTSNDA